MGTKTALTSMLENPVMNVMESGTTILVTTNRMMRKLLPSAKLCHRYAKHGWKGKESVSNIGLDQGPGLDKWQCLFQIPHQSVLIGELIKTP